MITRFNFPTRIQFGPGAVALVAEEIELLGGNRPLLVTDPGLAEVGVLDTVKNFLRASAVRFSVFKEVSPNPTGDQVEEGAAAYRDAGCDSIIAIGGGSPLDAAKAIQIRINHHEPLEDYDDLRGGDELITGELPPCLAIPTTAGTGSEVSRSAVITVEAADRKVVLFAAGLMPGAALCDPELTFGLPPRLTAETGMDALSHNLEAYLSKGYHPMADSIAMKGIVMISGHLRRAVENGKDLEARSEMMAASTMGAVAFQKGLGVNHSLAHPLSSVSGVPHGLANSIMMPHTVRYNAEEVPERVAVLAKLLEAEEESPQGAAEALERMARDIGLPLKLSDVGVKEDEIPKLVEKAMEDGCHGTNPRPVTEEDLEALLRAAM